jgi:hypothetical protein
MTRSAPVFVASAAVDDAVGVGDGGGSRHRSHEHNQHGRNLDSHLAQVVTSFGMVLIEETG